MYKRKTFLGVSCTLNSPVLFCQERENFCFSVISLLAFKRKMDVL